MRERHRSREGRRGAQTEFDLSRRADAQIDGIRCFRAIGNEVPVIFVTAYDQYAMRAFDVHAVDYLLKPIGRERFDAALERAKSRLGGKMPPAHELAAPHRPPHHF